MRTPASSAELTGAFSLSKEIPRPHTETTLSPMEILQRDRHRMSNLASGISGGFRKLQESTPDVDLSAEKSALDRLGQELDALTATIRDIRTPQVDTEHDTQQIEDRTAIETPIKRTEEQLEYYRFRDKRKRLYDESNTAASQNPESKETLDYAYKYLTEYGVEPAQDRFFAREVSNHDELLQILGKGDGTRVNLPILVDRRPVVISVYRIDRRSYTDNSPEAKTKRRQLGGLEGFNQAMNDLGIKHQFLINIGFENSKGEMRVIGKSDFHIRNTRGELIAYGGYAVDRLVGMLDSSIDRRHVQGSSHTPLKTDARYLEQSKRKGLGKALYSIGRELASDMGAKVRVVEADRTAKDSSHQGTSFYVIQLGARLETRPIPLESGGYKDAVVPVFDTQETPEQPYQFGYWFPK